MARLPAWSLFLTHSIQQLASVKLQNIRSRQGLVMNPAILCLQQSQCQSGTWVSNLPCWRFVVLGKHSPLITHTVVILKAGLCDFLRKPYIQYCVYCCFSELRKADFITLFSISRYPAFTLPYLFTNPFPICHEHTILLCLMVTIRFPFKNTLFFRVDPSLQLWNKKQLSN